MNGENENQSQYTHFALRISVCRVTELQFVGDSDDHDLHVPWQRGGVGDGTFAVREKQTVIENKQFSKIIFCQRWFHEGEKTISTKLPRKPLSPDL